MLYPFCFPCSQCNIYICSIYIFFSFSPHPYLSPSGLYYTCTDWLRFLRFKLGSQVFFVRAAQKKGHELYR